MTKELELTPGERKQAWDSVFEEPIEFDHKPSSEEILDLRLEAVAKAQFKKVVEWGDESCKEHISPSYFGQLKRRACPDCWQTLLEEVKDAEGQG